MTRKGRKPLATGHVDGLNGSELAKQRLKTILDTLSGKLTIPEACAALDVCPARFHVLRHEWLQRSAELLEPKPMGRPAKRSPAVDGEELAALRSENERLRHELQVGQVREEIWAVLPQGADASTGAPKKTASADRRRRPPPDRGRHRAK